MRAYNFTHMSAKNHHNTILTRINEWLYDHHYMRTGLDWTFTFIVSTISALIFAFGFVTFISPDVAEVSGGKFVSGGLSGVSQVITLFFQICGWRDIDTQTAYSVLYFVLNIPLVILAFFGIGKRFAVFTLINVAEVSIFTRIMPASSVEVFKQIAIFTSTNAGLLGRALFAGIMTGLSSALCFKVDISAGGIDVISYYIALKKGTLVGKYSVVINALNLVVFVLFTTIKAIQYDQLGLPLDGNEVSSWTATLSIVENSGSATAVPIATSISSSSDPVAVASVQFASALHSIIYFFTSMLVIDRINVRNKKLKIEVVTDNESLGEVLISTVPHGATVLKGTGVYTGKEKFIITMVVSSYEVKTITKVIKEQDPTSFIQITALNSVVGRFFMKPIK